MFEKLLAADPAKLPSCNKWLMTAKVNKYVSNNK